MNYTTLHLSEEQIKFLESKKYGIDRMECFRYFLYNAATNDSIVRVIDLDIQLKVGQCVCSKVQLAKLWKVDRKTVIGILADFKRYQLVSSEENYRTTVHTLLCVPEFEENGERHINTFFQKYDPELNVKKARYSKAKKEKAILSKEKVPEVHEEVMKTVSTDSQSEVEDKSTPIPPTATAKEEEKVHTPASKNSDNKDKESSKQEVKEDGNAQQPSSAYYQEVDMFAGTEFANPNPTRIYKGGNTT